MLKSILMVTLLSSNLCDTEAAYETFLDYQVAERGIVSSELAENWAQPRLQGQQYLLMRPRSNANVWLRFIDDPENRLAKPMRRTGWNATEILVQDPDALADSFRRVANSPFKIIGEPNYLTDKQNIRAMQVFGPSGEMLYLTRVIDPDKAAFNIGQAESFVDRVFIMVLGTHDMDETSRWYQQQLGHAMLGPFDYRVSVLSKTWGLPPDTLYPLGIIQLPDQYLIEIDEYPEAAASLLAPELQLPAGVLMVTFNASESPPRALTPVDPPSAFAQLPYMGRTSTVIRGPSGELIELVSD